MALMRNAEARVFGSVGTSVGGSGGLGEGAAFLSGLIRLAAYVWVGVASRRSSTTGIIRPPHSPQHSESNRQAAVLGSRERL